MSRLHERKNGSVRNIPDAKDQWYVLHVLSNKERRAVENLNRLFKEDEEMGALLQSAPLVPIEKVEDVRKGKGGDFPRHLQNMHADTYTMEREQGYKYPHNFPGHWVKQQYLPDELVGTHYYQYGSNKLEQAAKQYWQAIKKED